ncbi:hypothetical protein [Streptomyces sp. Ag109_O5-10]|uniref:hypothetical protein n=1 Tax=Streptomyces sp. Ag109_O5-10 TaxID=1855349 RepID=UPI00089A0293|nr:hypothetical protein [Streptomyces sp. Ag109_O5-10]SEF16725.1 hypothetical protein SAMN05216533_7953 [Streptomyces sp. Ag109_O5-10]
MTTRFDDEPEFDGPDDPLAVILRPPAAHLGPPPGRYEQIRRAAGRRRLVRTAAGAGVTCAVAVCVALSLHLTAPAAPHSPQVPLAPPALSPTAPHRPSGSPTPATPSPRPSVAPTQRASTQAPARGASATPSTAPSALRHVPSADRPSAARAATR